MEFLTWLLLWLFPNCKFDGTSFGIDDYLANGGNDGIGPGALQNFSLINIPWALSENLICECLI